MKISEIMHSSPEVIISKIGNGPYLYYDSDGEITIDCSLERILNMYVKNGQLISDIEIYAYGFKKDEQDTHHYINAEDLKKRFAEMEKEDSYEFIEPMEDHGKILQVPGYCGFDVLLTLNDRGVDTLVNCKPIKDVINEEYRRRIEKSDNLRK